MSAYPDDADFTVSPYCNKALCTEDAYLKERFEIAQRHRAQIEAARAALMTRIAEAAHELWFNCRRRKDFIQTARDHLDDMMKDTIDYELADAKQKMEGN